MNLAEQHKMYLHDGWLWPLSDDPRPLLRLGPPRMPHPGPLANPRKEPAKRR